LGSAFGKNESDDGLGVSLILSFTSIGKSKRATRLSQKRKRKTKGDLCLE